MNHRFRSCWIGLTLFTAALLLAGCTSDGHFRFLGYTTEPNYDSTIRTVYAADWLQVSPSLLLFEICADAYLKQMVRTIVGSLLWVGTGRWTPEQFEDALHTSDRRAAGPNAPAAGLSLWRIDY